MVPVTPEVGNLFSSAGREMGSDTHPSLGIAFRGLRLIESRMGHTSFHVVFLKSRYYRAGIQGHYISANHSLFDQLVDERQTHRLKHSVSGVSQESGKTLNARHRLNGIQSQTVGQARIVFEFESQLGQSGNLSQTPVDQGAQQHVMVIGFSPAAHSSLLGNRGQMSKQSLITKDRRKVGTANQWKLAHGFLEFRERWFVSRFFENIRA